MTEFEQRRKHALERLDGAVAVVTGAPTRYRNSDTEYAFRQDSTFHYLTGFDEPDSVLVLCGQSGKSVLFLRSRDREREIWDGYRLGVERAVESLSVDEAYAIDELSERLPKLLVGTDRLFYERGDERADADVQRSLERARASTHRAGIAPRAVISAGAIFDEMRLRKSAHEIELMRKSAAATRRAHEAAMRMTAAGRFEYEIEARFEYECRIAGAQRLAYQSIVASGDNATTLHYVDNTARLADGDLLLIDAAAEYEYYATDVTRTWPVNGRFTPEQRAIYEIVLKAQEAAIAAVRPGNTRARFHDVAVATIVEGLIDVGLLHGSVEENIASDAYRAFYMHGTGHWLGLDVHDAGRLRDDDDRSIVLEASMVTTIEPGIYVRRDTHADSPFAGIGIRIEDDIVVTADGNENLTAAIPKSIEALEAIVGTNA